MTAPAVRSAELIRRLTQEAFDAEGEGRALVAAAGRASALHLEMLERVHAMEAKAARVRMLDFVALARELQPTPPAPRRTGRERLP